MNGSSRTAGPGRSLRGPALLLCALLLGAAAQAAEPPTLVTITLDGDFDDWASVLANPRNVTVDGDGSSVPCTQSVDRDCAVQRASEDLARFAWTCDATALYVYVERFGGASANIFLHLDLDRDGVMEAGTDRVAPFWPKNNGPVSYYVYEYNPASPGGDSLADAEGFADGYPIPGGLGAWSGWQRLDMPVASPDGLRFEADIPWSALGLAGPAPVQFHLGANNSFQPDGTKDNLGAPDGRIGTTAFRHHEIAPPRTGSTAPGQTILYSHRIANLGNLPDSYRIRTLSSEGYEVLLHADPDGDGVPDSLMAVDARGNGRYTDSGDELLADGDGDTWPETGEIAPGADFPLVVELRPARSAKSYFDTTRVAAASLDDGSEEEVEDLTAVGWITLMPPRRISTEPGVALLLPHDLQNNLPTRTCVNFEWASARGWPYELWTDPDGDGVPSDGVALRDWCGDGDPDLQPAAGEVIPFVATAPVPPSAPLGTQETFVLRGDSPLSGSYQALVTDQVTVADLLSLAPSYRIADGTGKSAAAGRSLYFRHRLTWSGLAPDSFLLSAAAPPGHAVTLVSDPNGDGRPGDGSALGASASSGPVAPLGGSYPFLVRLDVAAGTPPGTPLSVAVTAASESNPGLARQADDEAVVTLVAAYSDPLFVLQESRFEPCSTVYALATGLVPKQTDRYRIRWEHTAEPLTVRATPIPSDGAGEGSDLLAMDGASLTGPYALSLEEWNGREWVELSRDELVVSSLGAVHALVTDKSTYAIAGDDLLVAALYENTGPTRLLGTVIHFLILDPGRTLSLRSDGTFAPVVPGEWSWTAGPFDLRAGETRSEAFTIGPVEFPTTGAYLVEASGEGSCGNETGSLSIGFQVVADSDGDGWTDAEESGFGTDPYDQDTDDDGILDPADGAGDADGDTWIDALECDSDADDLPDGLEAGLFAALLGPDTDLAAGCFRADADAGATVTDRLDPDTDGGGLRDGAEDLDLDGGRDPGEKDPLDTTDDPCAWAAPPEVPSLEVSRRGGDVLLSWTDLSAADPCLSYRVLAAADAVPSGPGPFAELATGLLSPALVHSGAAADGSLRFYLAAAQGRIGGPGPLGRFGR